MSKNICIISHQHLCRNPRVLKEANAIASIGYSVTILTSIYSAKLLAEDQLLFANTNIRYQFYNNLVRKNLRSYVNRICNKAGRWLTKLDIENKWALGYAPTTCLHQALKQNADLYIVHQELPTYVGCQLIKRGKKVAFDFEDWYSQDLLEQAQNYRPDKLLIKAEQIGLKNGAFSYTTSNAMAKAMQKHYALAHPPQVVYNSFKSYKGKLRETLPDAIKLIWLSQTIGPGRGLEEITDALNAVHSKAYHLHLRGNVSPNYQQYLSTLLSNPLHQLHFLNLIPNDTIAENLAQYDIGLALEPNYPPNKDLTISNKIFHYLSVGLPVIASKTQGQWSLKNDFDKSIFYFENREDLIAILNNFEPFGITARQEVLDRYIDKYDWQTQAKKIQQLTKAIF